MKVCNTCHIPKREHDFGRVPKTPNQRRASCSGCTGGQPKGGQAHLYAMTLEEVAERLGVSRQYVHRIEQSALAKLRRYRFRELLVMQEEAERVSLRRYKLNLMEPA